MTHRPTVFRWSPSVDDGPAEDLRSLARRLTPLAADRSTDAALLARETAGVLVSWLREPRAARAVRALPGALDAWRAAHGWRAACVRLVRLVETELAQAPDSLDPDPLRAALAERLEREGVIGPAERERELARQAAERLARGEEVLLLGPNEALACALEEAWRAGSEPRCLLGEGRPDLIGKRVARRLVRAGPRVTVALDAALAQLLERVDRVWVGTEAVTVDRFQARLGDGALLERARLLEIPCELLATSDTDHPAAGLRLPSRPDEEREFLWGDAPEGVSVLGAFLDDLPLAIVDRRIDEHGARPPSARRPTDAPIPLAGDPAGAPKS